MGLDAIELIMGWEEACGIMIEDEEAEMLRNPLMAIDLFCDRLGAIRDVEGICHSHRAFNQVRQAIQTTLGIERAQIKPRTVLRKILPKENRKEIWQAICDLIDTPSKPDWNWATGIYSGPSTVQDFADWLAYKHPRHFIDAATPWTHAQVRSIVRAVIRYQSGEYKFSDQTQWNQLP